MLPCFADRQSEFERALCSQSFTRRFGGHAVVRLSGAAAWRPDVIPTGSLGLDIALGIGGIPRGRVAEIYGPESSGKTTLCQHIIANEQEMGGLAVFVDMEHALDPAYAARCGVRVDDLYISQPDSGEQALEIVEAVVKAGASLVVVDSVAALVPRAEIEGVHGDIHSGLHARLMSQAMRKLVASRLLQASGCALVFTNQLRFRLGVMFGNPETTTGGVALRYYASLRVDLRRVQALKDGGEVIGDCIKATIRKNKLAPPFRTAEFTLLHGRGIDTAAEILEWGMSARILVRDQGQYRFNGTILGSSKYDVTRDLRDDPALCAKIAKEIRSTFNSSLPEALAG